MAFPKQWWCARTKLRAKAAGGAELAKAVSDETLRSSQLAFTEHDTNKNGTIELGELAALLRALDLLRFVAALPSVPVSRAAAAPTRAAVACTAGDGGGVGGDVSDALWNQRYDFRELLCAASVLSPDCCSWPVVSVPQVTRTTKL